MTSSYGNTLRLLLDHTKLSKDLCIVIDDYTEAMNIRKKKMVIEKQIEKIVYVHYYYGEISSHWEFLFVPFHLFDKIIRNAIAKEEKSRRKYSRYKWDTCCCLEGALKAHFNPHDNMMSVYSYNNWHGWSIYMCGELQEIVLIEFKKYRISKKYIFGLKRYESNIE